VSAHSTIIVSREKARMYLIRRAMTMTDDALVSALDRELDERLYTVRIVSDDRGPDDDLLDWVA